MTRALLTQAELEAEMTAADLALRDALRRDDIAAADQAGVRFDTALEQWRLLTEKHR
jgi:hypothetical protein